MVMWLWTMVTGLKSDAFGIYWYMEIYLLEEEEEGGDILFPVLT